MARPLIALDADGVLLDFHLGYASAWQRAFGHAPAERDPLAYWPMDRWAVERLDAVKRVQFRAAFDEQFADLFLREGVIGFLFSDLKAFGGGRREVEQCGSGKVVEENGIGVFEETAGLQSDEFGIARSGANQVNLAHTTPGLPALPSL